MKLARSSYYYQPKRRQSMAKAAHAPLLGQLPIDPELAKLCDVGNIERYDSGIYNTFIHDLAEALSRQKE